MKPSFPPTAKRSNPRPEAHAPAGPAHHFRCFRLPRQQIAYVTFLVQAHEGIAQVTSIPGRGEILWLIPESQRTAAEALIAALAREIAFEEIPFDRDAWHGTTDL